MKSSFGYAEVVPHQHGIDITRGQQQYPHHTLDSSILLIDRGMYIVVEPCSCVPTGVDCAEASIANGRVPVAELKSRNPPCRLTNAHCNISLSIATRGEINIR